MTSTEVKTNDSLQKESNISFISNEMSVTVTDYNCNNVNPSPLKLPKDGELLEEFLSPRKLQALTGVDNLETVEYLEMRVNTEQMSLGNFGMYLPNLSQIKLSGSYIPSIRDLGTSLWSLQVLWMPQCSLCCLDGLVTIGGLRELYLAYNEIHDVSSCGMLESLEILDLEGNLISDSGGLHYMSMCGQLTRLTLEGNPMCQQTAQDTEDGYRDSVFRAIPQLQFLDDLPRSWRGAGSMDPSAGDDANLDESLMDPATAAIQFESHWTFINSVLLESGLLAEMNPEPLSQAQQPSQHSPGDSGRPPSSYLSSPSSISFTSSGPSSARPRPATAALFANSQHGTSPRPLTGMLSSRRPLSSGQSRPDTASTGDSNFSESLDRPDDSCLTSGQLVCGNLTSSLRRHRGQVAGPTKETAMTATVVAAVLEVCGESSMPLSLRQRRPRTSMPTATAAVPAAAVIDALGPYEDNCDKILEELSQWKKDYEKSRARIEAHRAPQVLTIEYSEGDIEELDATLHSATTSHRPLDATSDSVRQLHPLARNVPKLPLTQTSQTKSIQSKSATHSTSKTKFSTHSTGQSKSTILNNNQLKAKLPPTGQSNPPASSLANQSDISIEPPTQLSRIRRQLLQAGSTTVLAPSKPQLKKLT